MQTIINKNPNSKYIYLLAGFLIVVLSGITFLPCLRKLEINIHNKTIISYDDRYDKTIPGKSEILAVNSEVSELTMRYILRQGFTYPYAGIIIPLKDSSGNFLDCTRFDVLKIRIASAQLSDCKIYLKVFDDKISTIDDPLSERYLKKDLVLNSIPKTIAIPFKQFITPEWWFQNNNITLKDVTPVDFSKVVSLQIESGSTAKTGIIDTLTISHVVFTHRPNIYTLSLLIILFVLFIVYMFLRSIPQQKNDPIIISYDKKDVHSYREIDTKRIAAHFAEHFAEPELTIITMGRALGLSQKRIAKVMSDEFKMSFKQYLTSIRIHEAKRLLQETDRLVIDISLEVGFNSISHFNRVFKSATNVTPLEFRNKKDGKG